MDTPIRYLHSGRPAYATREAIETLAAQLGFTADSPGRWFSPDRRRHILIVPTVLPDCC